MKRVTKLTLMILAVAATGATAQNSANIAANAAVQQPITVTGTTTLDFQNVFPGVSKTIAVTATTAGVFTLGGQGSATVNMTLAVPLNLVSGGNNLPIGTWTGYKNSTNSPTSGGTAFTTVASGSIGTLVLSAGGAGFVFLGATVTPAVAQPAGSYTATITLTATY